MSEEEELSLASGVEVGYESVKCMERLSRAEPFTGLQLGQLLARADPMMPSSSLIFLNALRKCNRDEYKPLFEPLVKRNALDDLMRLIHSVLTSWGNQPGARPWSMLAGVASQLPVLDQRRMFILVQLIDVNGPSAADTSHDMPYVLARLPRILGTNQNAFIFLFDTLYAWLTRGGKDRVKYGPGPESDDLFSLASTAPAQFLRPFDENARPEMFEKHLLRFCALSEGCWFEMGLASSVLHNTFSRLLQKNVQKDAMIAKLQSLFKYFIDNAVDIKNVTRWDYTLTFAWLFISKEDDLYKDLKGVVEPQSAYKRTEPQWAYFYMLAPYFEKLPDLQPNDFFLTWNYAVDNKLCNYTPVLQGLTARLHQHYNQQKNASPPLFGKKTPPFIFKTDLQSTPSRKFLSMTLQVLPVDPDRKAILENYLSNLLLFLPRENDAQLSFSCGMDHHGFMWSLYAKHGIVPALEALSFIVWCFAEDGYQKTLNSEGPERVLFNRILAAHFSVSKDGTTINKKIDEEKLVILEKIFLPGKNHQKAPFDRGVRPDREAWSLFKTYLTTISEEETIPESLRTRVQTVSNVVNRYAWIWDVAA